MHLALVDWLKNVSSDDLDSRSVRM